MVHKLALANEAMMQKPAHRGEIATMDAVGICLLLLSITEAEECMGQHKRSQVEPPLEVTHAKEILATNGLRFRPGHRHAMPTRPIHRDGTRDRQATAERDGSS